MCVCVYAVISAGKDALGQVDATTVLRAGQVLDSFAGQTNDESSKKED